MSAEKSNEQIQDAIQKELEGTEYAVASLTPLTGGTANFLYHARLDKSLPDGTSEIVLKHGEAYVAQHPGFKLKMVRCNIEEESLRLLSEFPHVVSFSYDIGTPKLYHFNHETSTQVQEYLSDAVNLKHYALKHLQAPTSQAAELRCRHLGQCLGSWLREFHNWSDQPERKNLRELLAGNEEMRNIKKMINYDELLRRVSVFPTLLQDHKGTLQQIVNMATSELEDNKKLSVIHGDFWTGNVLLPNANFEDDQLVPVRIIDWEMAQVGVQAEDVGQLIAELWQLKLYKEIDAALLIIDSFVEGYGKINVDFAFRVLIHVGAHLICIGSTTPGWGTPEEGQTIVKMGRDVLINAWKRDAEAFERHDLYNILRQSV